MGDWSPSSPVFINLFTHLYECGLMGYNPILLYFARRNVVDESIGVFFRLAPMLMLACVFLEPFSVETLNDCTTSP